MRKSKISSAYGQRRDGRIRTIDGEVYGFVSIKYAAHAVKGGTWKILRWILLE
jgi:hypothetical protein